MTAPSDEAPPEGPPEGPLYRAVTMRPGVAAGPGPVAPELPVFTTVRPLDLADLKRTLKRRMTRAGPARDAADAPLHAVLETLLKDKRPPPEVVVVEWPPQGEIRLDSALVGGTLMLGAHLSAHWAEGALSDAAKQALERALRAFEGARRQSRHPGIGRLPG